MKNQFVFFQSLAFSRDLPMTLLILIKEIVRVL